MTIQKCLAIEARINAEPESKQAWKEVMEEIKQVPSVEEREYLFLAAALKLLKLYQIPPL